MENLAIDRTASRPEPLAVAETCESVHQMRVRSSQGAAARLAAE